MRWITKFREKHWKNFIILILKYLGVAILLNFIFQQSWYRIPLNPIFVFFLLLWIGVSVLIELLALIFFIISFILNAIGSFAEIFEIISFYLKSLPEIILDIIYDIFWHD